MTFAIFYCFIFGVATFGYASQLPNIVYILFDDVGITDLFNNNSENIVSTPFLNGLVKDGIKFTKVSTHCFMSFCDL